MSNKKMALKRSLLRSLTAAGMTAALMLAPAAEAAPALGAYNVNLADTSVSGLSSGGFMASQLGVAWSSVFARGFGVFAGGPYDCAQSQSYTACMYNGNPSLTGMIANMNNWSGNQIDPVANLANRKIYIFTGTSDTTVGPNETQALYNQLVTTGHFAPAGNVKYDNTNSATHTFPTDFSGTGDNACSNSASPYISNCNFDGAGAVLQWIYGTLNARNNGTLGGSLVQFDQSAFIGTGKGMDTTGWLYVPAACASGAQCKLHVALHGCLQSQSNIQQKFLNNTGYNKWADTNNIIILYPQAIPDNTSHATAGSGTLPNGNGCWDWIGWYGSNFAQKAGVQQTAIVNMVKQIASGYVSLAAPTGLSVTGTSNSSISLSWNSLSGAAGYNVYRNGVQVNSTAISGTSYTDSGLTSGTSYTYTVQGVTSGGAGGAQSAPVTGTTTGTPPALPAPTGLTVTGTTSSSVSLSWSAETGAASYNVYRNGSKVNASAVTTNSYTDSGLVASTAYNYAVTAVNSSGESAQSATVTGTTKSSWTCSTTTTSNYYHVQAGRAHDSGGYALANGSNQNMGLDNVFYTATLAQTAPGYYVIGNCP